MLHPFLTRRPRGWYLPSLAALCALTSGCGMEMPTTTGTGVSQGVIPVVYHDDEPHGRCVITGIGDAVEEEMAHFRPDLASLVQRVPGGESEPLLLAEAVSFPDDDVSDASPDRLVSDEASGAAPGEPTAVERAETGIDPTVSEAVQQEIASSSAPVPQGPGNVAHGTASRGDIAIMAWEGAPRDTGIAWQSPAPWSGDDRWSERQLADFRMAEAVAREGQLLAGKGAPFAARSKIQQALRIVAQSLDLSSGGTFHQKALANGIRALDEVDDFAPASIHAASDSRLKQVVSSHRTPVLKHFDLEPWSAAAARDRYLEYAREQLAAAVGKVPVGSAALHTLARMQVALCRPGSSPPIVHEKALAICQAALMVDELNYLAARDLGAIYAAHGMHRQACEHYVRSLSTRPSAETWRALAAVYRRAGNQEAARHAEAEAARLPEEGVSSRFPVVWLTPARFGQALDVAMFEPAVHSRERSSAAVGTSSALGQ